MIAACAGLEGRSADAWVAAATIVAHFLVRGRRGLILLDAHARERAQHPTLHRPYVACGYQPMVDLLRYLEANGFNTYIASGGDRDFTRPATREMYGIPREHVIGSTSAMEFKDDERGGAVRYKAEMEFFDDGPVKPVRIWSRIGRRPILAGGNSNGDIQMLQFAQHADKPSLRLLLLHDDAEREHAYDRQSHVGQLNTALDEAQQRNWIVVSMINDWRKVFSFDR